MLSKITFTGLALSYIALGAAIIYTAVKQVEE